MFEMFKRVCSNLRDGALFGPSHRFEQRLELGSAGLVLPQGWRVTKKNDEICTLRPADDLQQATISLIRFKSSPDFDAFKMLCDKRLAAEKRVLGSGFVEAQPPAFSQGVFNMFFSGGNEENGHLFSGCLMLVKSELYTIYLEGTGISTRQHVESFAVLLSRFKTK
jgi:hypothetical protein